MAKKKRTATTDLVQYRLDGTPDDPVPPKKPKKVRSTIPDPAIQRCLDAYYAAFVRKFNPPETAEPWLADHSIEKHLMMLPLIRGGKDSAFIKQLLAAWGEAEVLRCLAVYFETTDLRVIRSDYTVGAFFALAQHVKLIGTRTTDVRDAGNIDAATRATKRRA